MNPYQNPEMPSPYLRESDLHPHASIEIVDLSKSFGEKGLFRNFSARIVYGNRIGIVGNNGSGKTTLLEILASREEPSSGYVGQAESLSIGYLPQTVKFEGPTVLEVMTNDIRVVVEALDRLETMNQNFQPDDLSFLEEYAALQEIVDQHDGYSIPSRVEKALSTVGLSKTPQAKVEELSGGEQMKLSLARILMTSPNLLILDEPTNHLDFKTRIWLENFLSDYKGTVIIVSHDRHLLNKLVTAIWHVDGGQIKEYSGNYEFFLRQSEIEDAQAQAEYEVLVRQTKLIEKASRKEQERAAHGARRARGRKPKDHDRVRLGVHAETASRTAGKKRSRIQAKKEDVLAQVEEKRPRPKVEFRFDLHAPQKIKTRKQLLRLEGVSMGYGERQVISRVNLEIAYGDRVGIFGENGSGKTTLIRAILGYPETTVVGQLETASGVQIGFLDQQTRNLRLEKTVLENLLPFAKGWAKEKTRQHLARFLFRTNEEVAQRASTLSGGERMRLSLAQIGALNPALLIFDEPTNNLDLSSMEEMTTVLASFPGSLLIISHDLYFLRSIGIDQAFLIKEGKLEKLHYSPMDENLFEEELVEKM